MVTRQDIKQWWRATSFLSALSLGACAAHGGQPNAQAPAASETPGGAASQGQHEGSVKSDSALLAERVRSGDALRERIVRAIVLEDGPRPGNAKQLRVADQVRDLLQRAESSVPAAPYETAAVVAYERACVALEVAYLNSLLESTDPPRQPGAWAPDAGRDVIGSPTADAKLAQWQALDATRPLVKFALVRNADGRTLALRVGALDVAHVDIAGGHALAAGLMRFTFENGKPLLAALENTSGGFRPGALRNTRVVATLQEAGYLPPDPSAFTVIDNPTGGYDSSVLMPR